MTFFLFFPSQGLSVSTYVHISQAPRGSGSRHSAYPAHSRLLLLLAAVLSLHRHIIPLHKTYQIHAELRIPGMTLRRTWWQGLDGVHPCVRLGCCSTYVLRIYEYAYETRRMTIVATYGRPVSMLNVEVSARQRTYVRKSVCVGVCVLGTCGVI